MTLTLDARSCGPVLGTHGCSKRLFARRAHGERVQVRGRVVEWTQANGAVCDRTFRFDAPPLDVAVLVDDADDDATTRKSLCVLTSPDTITFISATGAVTDVPLPFKAAAIFAMTKGILIQRLATSLVQASVRTGKSPTLFSLVHPLEEIKPVVLETPSETRSCMFVADALESVVHVHESPPFVVFYHHDKTTLSVKSIVSSAPSASKPSSIVAEIVLRGIWESPELPSSDPSDTSIFVASDVDGQPLLAMMHRPSAQLLFQRLVWDGSELKVHASPTTFLPCCDAVPLLREHPSTFGYDVLVQERDGRLALYQGPHCLCVIGIDAPSPEPRAKLPAFGSSSPIAARPDAPGFDMTDAMLNETLPPVGIPTIAPGAAPLTFEVTHNDGSCRQFLVPLSLVAYPLLNRIFVVLDALLPPKLALAWRLQVVASPEPWTAFQSTLVPSMATNGPPKSAFERLQASAFHNTYYGLPLSGSRTARRCLRANSVAVRPTLALDDHIRDIFCGLHLLYEDLKLSSLVSSLVAPLGDVLHAIASTHGWAPYVAHYAADHGPRPMVAATSKALPDPFQGRCEACPVDVFAWLQHKMATHHFNTMEANKKQGVGRRVDAYPTLPVLARTATVVELYEALYPEAPMPLHARARHVVSRLAALSLPWEDLPVGVALPLKYAVYVTTHFPDASLCPEECRLVNRADLLPEHEVPCVLPLVDKDTLDASRDNDDGFPDVLLTSQPLFPKDQRLKEVWRLLRSNKPMLLKVQRDAHHSDADVLSLQQARLLLLCKRSMSLSVARGMVTLGSLTAQQSSASPYTARLSIPQLQLTARVSGTNAKTVLDISGYKEITHWPQFHNGVATALRLSPHDRVTVQWVLSHQPKPSADESDEAVRLYEEACAGHAGFLFGLGLQGQLQCQSPTTTYKYLSLGDELTSVGFLLGTAASTLHHPKDMNIERAVSKMLSMHIPSLWPPSFAHLHVPASAQTAAIMGLGLLYQSTGNRLMTEFLLTEMTQGPVLTSAGAASGATVTPSTEAVQFEGYALATGFALGLILLGRENDPGLVDLNLDAKLTKYMLGGEKECGHGSWAPTELNCVLRTRKLQQRELINVDVTASGSALALAFMYMWSNSASIGHRLHVPSTLVLLETIRPDVLFVRALAANLVLWSSIEPTRAWVINKQLPPPLRPSGLLHWVAIDDGGDPATIQEAYANIVAGACFSIGLKFAGTHHPGAKSVLLSFLDEFQLWRTKLGRAADVSRVTLERVLGTVAQSLALVMAGTGDLECLRVLRSLLLRHKADAHGDITYGNHMAMSSALGLLFLGGGRCSVRSSRLATAMLVVALYPMYPTKTTDQRYHLQAFRHLYVLAIDRTRLVRALDVDTHQWTPMPLRVWTQFSAAPLEVRTPTLLPARSMLRRLETAANDHFPIVVDWSMNDDSRAVLLEQQGVLRIKRKLGADAPRATFFASFLKLFATASTQASDAMWIAFCARLYEECKRENKPDCVAVYLNAKRGEVDVLERRITHTLLVANLQLVQLHMELDAHMFQASDDASAAPHDVGRLAQLVNEDFTLGYSNALLAFFEQLDLPISIETNEAPMSLLHAAYRRYLGSPLLAQLE